VSVKPIREPAVSGMFYSDSPKALTREIEEYLSAASPEKISGTIMGLIAPHAGYVYSGPVAAFGYKTLFDRSYDTVVVIAPSHRAYFDGASVMERGGYRTPLGIVEIDEELAGEICRATEIVTNDWEVHRREHALEVQLPFLQHVLKEFKLVPIIMGSQDTGLFRDLSESIGRAIGGSGKKVLVVGSTDLSHYHPYDKAVGLDNVPVRYLRAFDIDGMTRDFAGQKVEACGGGPMIVTMMIARSMGSGHSTVLKYMNSGDVTGDRSQVVGYVSGVFHT
jgi:MEMO1 family protein